MKPTCNTCLWFVEETEQTGPGKYSHEEAVKRGSGFCLIQDLFTEVQASDEACKDYLQEDKR